MWAERGRRVLRLASTAPLISAAGIVPIDCGELICGCGGVYALSTLLTRRMAVQGAKA